MEPPPVLSKGDPDRDGFRVSMRRDNKLFDRRVGIDQIRGRLHRPDTIVIRNPRLDPLETLLLIVLALHFN